MLMSAWISNRWSATIGLFLLVQVVKSAPVTPFTATWTLACFGNAQLADPDSCAVNNPQFGTGLISSNIAGSVTGPDGTTLATYESKAETQFDSLRNYSKLTVSDTDASLPTYLLTYSYAVDYLTVVMPEVQVGRNGFVSSNWRFRGSGIGADPPGGDTIAELYYYVGLYPFRRWRKYDVTNRSKNDVIVVHWPTTFGTTFAYEAASIAQVSISCGHGCSNWTGSGTSDFYNTMEFVGFSVFDENGTFLPEAQVLGESGIAYQTIDPVPEPSTFAGTFIILLLFLINHQRASLEQRNGVTVA